MKKIMALGLAAVVLFPALAARAAEFNVATEAAFRSALTTAGSNGQDDTINVAGGELFLSATLTYAPAATENNSLTIAGAPVPFGVDSSSLSGDELVQILNISTLTVASDAAAHVFIRDLAFVNGTGSGGSGGALFIRTASANVTIERSAFDLNASGADGGACMVQTAAGGITIRESRFSNNSAGNDGGGLRVATDAGAVLIRESRLDGNTANHDGGGLRVDAAGGALVMVNSVVQFNTATTGDGGGARIEAGNGAVNLTNNALIGNTAALSGGGAIVKLTSNLGSADLSNNIVYFNTAAGFLGGGDVFLDNDLPPDDDGVGSPVTLAHNDLSAVAATVPESVTQVNNIDAPPLLGLFLDLDAASPCIDAGLNTAPWLPDMDFNGNARIVGGVVDIGPIEFVPPPPREITGVSLSVRPRRIAAGGTSLLRGKLTNSAGAGIRGKRVRIKSGSRLVKVLTTGLHGGFALGVRPLRSKRFTAVFGGDAAFLPAVSRVVTVVVVR